MTQQLVNIGTTANDRTGDTWRGAFDKTNDNFTELYTSGGLTNVVKVNSLADFPDPVDGVIELVPTPGAEMVYLIGAINVDVGANRFTVTGGEVVIRGVHRTGSRITSSTTGSMFTSVDSAFFQEFIAFDCPNANWVDFASSTGGHSFANNNVIIINCDSLGTISGAFTSSFRIMTVVAAQSAGFLWSGALGSQINISNFLAISWAGTLLDLGTAEFSIVNITSDNRFLSPSGTTILSGAASSGNLPGSGRGLVASSLFNGVGTALSGIDSLDLKWQFDSNVFVDNTTQNTRNIADAFLTAAETVTITTQSVYVAVGGTSWDSDIADRFTVSTAGLVTYIGLGTIDIEVTAFSTVEKVGGGADKIASKIALDGVVQDKTIGATENATPTGITSAGIFTIASGTTIQLFVGNEGSTANVIVDESNMIIKGA